MSNKSNVADYDLMYVSETDKGLAVRTDGDASLFWLPKSQIDFPEKEYRRNQIIRVTVPDWLAEKHDLA
jgi:hypothetical protein